MKLGDLAHARAGDKGDTSIIVVIPYREKDFTEVGGLLGVVDVAEHFGVPPEQVKITPAPGLAAYTVVVRERLDGGVTRSRGGDPHGKTLSGHLLDLKAARTPGR